ncbi:acyl carrier protein [Pseudomonas saxonica]|uniref:Carrier domain-containing protein n=1 Tax=Pseudomonas saxonica TaxID=2600598 RepID=A0A5C5PRS5_9PSED|nr:acyl carrier protein [Pseudomonas saxonica]TWR79736.1 hypothetical protein FJD37_23075 [Pseudomonas saxonica]
MANKGFFEKLREIFFGQPSKPVAPPKPVEAVKPTPKPQEEIKPVETAPVTQTETPLIKELEQIIFNIIQKHVEPSDLLVESGLVDSLNAVDIVLAVQLKYGCKIPPTEIEEHLESLESLADFVNKNRTKTTTATA